MIFDTDVLIWAYKDNRKATSAIDANDARYLSIVSYMELLKGAFDKREVKALRSYLIDLDFQTLPLSADIGFRGSIIMEHYGLRTGLCVSDALIAATAIEYNLILCSGNKKHFKLINDLELSVFHP